MQFYSKALRGTLAAVAVLASLSAHAEYPDRPITLINPFPPGGATDRIARIFAPKLQAILGQPLVIDSRPGAGTVLGNGLAAKAKPDGYTLLISQIGWASNVSMMKNLPYDARTDFVTIAGMADVPGLVVASAGKPYNTFAEFVKYAKSHPDEVTYATTGNGTWPHLGMALLANQVGLPLTQVPYKGTSQALPDLVAGRVDTMVVSYASIEGLVKAGKLKILASATKSRVPELPDIPTVTELGYPEYTTSLWSGVVGPKGIPAEIVSKLEKAFIETAADPGVRKALAETYMVAMPLTSSELDKYQKAEIERWARLVKETGIQPQ